MVDSTVEEIMDICPHSLLLLVCLSLKKVKSALMVRDDVVGR